MEIPAIMKINKGEEIAAALMSAFIPGTGYYKFLAKKKENGKYEWVHFIQRVSGVKEDFCSGEVETGEQLNLIMEIMNRNLLRIFGQSAVMKPGSPTMYTTSGVEIKKADA